MDELFVRGIVGDTMPGPGVVVGTDVVVAGLRSRRGVAFRLLSEVGQGPFEIALSVPLLLEYEDALRRPQVGSLLGQADVDAVLDYFCKVAHLRQIFFLWRPLLPDPKDDMLLELGVAARCQSIVTYNVRDFVGAEKFGISVLEPGPFLSGVGVLK
jgi:predicted nucleic acid-binding protein